MTPPSTPAKPALSALPERARISGSETRRRKHAVLVRLDDHEHDDITRLALAEGVSLPDVLRAGLTSLLMQEAHRG